ncbi:NADPH:quinone reductase [Pseudidiomarina salinarum]|uniref:Zinc-type alcohol dehydrogenase-like protein n=1 Tax=Pseudidiomarina salinarum TaxID=435908 RepID=A0A094JH95_9GAMM|nr:zinc-binding alcohol dehydrogenase family protein [Pseudidiomarina salinarum]KFZ31921.1 NADPH:quinone reductase [Pseudidiomarina salinarum]RUO70305.1 zinc-binding alcohol dehydrogenase family protein [Pseudidiomarina salinarum]
MRAVGYKKSLPASHNEALLDIILPEPEPEPNDVIVKVQAVGVNPVDTKIRMRKEPARGETAILGWDAAGIVTRVGSKVTEFQAGDEVWYAGAVDRPGCNAELHAVDARIISRKPASLSFAEAAAMPLTFLTAWELLFDRLDVKHDDEHAVILVTGAAGGVGSALIQLAKALTEATVVGTASRVESRNWVTQLGADHVIDHSKSLVEAYRKLNLSDVTHVASITHSDQHFDDLVELLQPQGKLALIDDPATPLDVSKMKQKSLSLHWEFMYTRSMFQTADMGRQGEILAKVAELTDAGTITTTMTTNLGNINAANLRTAHSQLESQHTIGKIVLAGFGS